MDTVPYPSSAGSQPSSEDSGSATRRASRCQRSGREWREGTVPFSCFVEDTYFVPFNQSFPQVVHPHRDLEIHYYQWVPFLLVAQMLLFMLPKMA